MTKEEYKAYLLTDHWKQLRKLKLEEKFERCEICGVPTRLEVHHLSYDNLYHEPLSDLQVLCHYHHGQIHDIPMGGSDWQIIAHCRGQERAVRAREKKKKDDKRKKANRFWDRKLRNRAKAVGLAVRILYKKRAEEARFNFVSDVNKWLNH